MYCCSMIQRTNSQEENFIAILFLRVEKIEKRDIKASYLAWLLILGESIE